MDHDDDGDRIHQREIKVCKCLSDLNPRGWVCVEVAMRTLRQTRCRLWLSYAEGGGGGIVETIAVNLFPKQRPWYFGVKCDKFLLSAVFQAAMEYIFDIDLTISPEHLLVFHDAFSGRVYEVTDRWFDYWFLIVRESDDDSSSSTRSDCTIRDTSDSMAEFDELSLLGDLIIQV